MISLLLSNKVLKLLNGWNSPIQLYHLFYLIIKNIYFNFTIIKIHLHVHARTHTHTIYKKTVHNNKTAAKLEQQSDHVRPVSTQQHCPGKEEEPLRPSALDQRTMGKRRRRGDKSEARRKAPGSFFHPSLTSLATFSVVVDPQQSQALAAEISTLLTKKAIREVLGDQRARFSCYGNGKLRPPQSIQFLDMCLDASTP